MVVVVVLLLKTGGWLPFMSIWNQSRPERMAMATMVKVCIQLRMSPRRCLKARMAMTNIWAWKDVLYLRPFLMSCTALRSSSPMVIGGRLPSIVFWFSA